ncbi:hypothetical protein E2C01_003393 [Portunus trituberculatus]|uniref:Uncharacterized protein n=1 Tax=Portunus trituberculatus TaxID=210409 RepID=A0A5B7CTF6_PORTR|nr:hypothetical protein [Portunus trituberculatus]
MSGYLFFGAFSIMSDALLVRSEGIQFHIQAQVSTLPPTSYSLRKPSSESLSFSMYCGTSSSRGMGFTSTAGWDMSVWERRRDLKILLQGSVLVPAAIEAQEGAQGEGEEEEEGEQTRGNVNNLHLGCPGGRVRVVRPHHLLRLDDGQVFASLDNTPSTSGGTFCRDRRSLRLPRVSGAVVGWLSVLWEGVGSPVGLPRQEEQPQDQFPATFPSPSRREIKATIPGRQDFLTLAQADNTVHCWIKEMFPLAQ